MKTAGNNVNGEVENALFVEKMDIAAEIMAMQTKTMEIVHPKQPKLLTNITTNVSPLLMCHHQNKVCNSPLCISESSS